MLGHEHEALQGYTQLNKEHLLVALSKALGIQHEHHDVVGVDKAAIKARIREVMESKLAPNFDFERMTALAMGRNWRDATPEQQKRLTVEFKTLLVRTYSGALTQYRDQTIDYKPLRADPNAADVLVRTEVIRQGQPPVQIDYGMEKKDDAWKAYDVVVGGVSLVTNYRDEFNEQVRAGCIDGLIKTLAAKNGGGAK